MDNDVSSAIHITVQLVIVSVIVGMLALFTTLGQSFSRESSTTIADTIALTHAAELSNAANYNGAIPAASAFVILNQNSSAIRNLYGYAYSEFISEPNDLIELMSKKVRLKITRIEDAPDKDLYDVEVKEE